MSTRVKSAPAAWKNSLKKSDKYREMLRRAARKFHLESLEDRRMFAVDPVLVAADGGVQFNTAPAPTTVRNESPRELTFTFTGVPGMDRTSLATGIRLQGANKDGVFDGNDLFYTPAYLDLGNDATQVVMRFATPLPDDLYRLTFVGASLKASDGLPFNQGTNFTVDFNLNLAPQILAVVPQPIVRDATTGTLSQLRNQVHVYFNNDDLNPTLATDPAYYRLLVTRGTVDPSDDAPSGLEITPTSVTYDPLKDKVVLHFSANLETYAPAGVGADTAVAFRLRTGTTEIRRPNVYGVSGGGSNTDWITKDPGSMFSDATNLQNVLVRGLPPGANLQSLESFINAGLPSTANNPNVLAAGTSVIIGQSIDPQYYNLIWPGGNDDPGHRNVTVQNHPGGAIVIAPQNRVQTVIAGSDGPENHLGNAIFSDPIFQPAATADQVNGITTFYYNFRNELGYVPDTSTGTIPTQPTFNVITDRQKQRARESLELIGRYAGVNFVETENQGFIIATGDMRSILTTVQTGPGGITGLAGAVDLDNNGIPETAAVIMDAGEDWTINGADLFGNAWFQSATHEILEGLGLGHSYDLPLLTLMGGDPGLSNGLPGPEPVFPGDHDIYHAQHLYRPESKDIDLFKFEIDTKGVFTAEVFAERLATSSQLDSALSIFRVNPTTQIPELYARNDDYFSKDAFIELQLEPGTYYVGVTASGNNEYDPNIRDSGSGGTTQGAYQLKLDFRKAATQSLTDNSGIAGGSGVALDGDSDGKPGGVNNFWFRAAPTVNNLADLQSTTRTARTIYVDRLGGGSPLAADVAPRDGDADNAAYVPEGTLARPFLSIKRALEASKPFDIIRVVGNNLNPLADTADADLANNLAYQIGFDRLGLPLADGTTLDVPKDRTVMFDAGAVVQLRRAQISVGSENQGATADRSGGALQVLGTPWQNVYFTSFNRANPANLTAEPQIGKNENFAPDFADEGDWGGIAFRNDIDQADGRFDLEDRGIFLNYISNADIRYGGGQVVVNSSPRIVNPIHMTDARPTIINNKIHLNADAAMSANPDSFEESNFSSPQYGSTFNSSFNVDYKRVGPEIHGNIVINNTVNALSIRARTQSGALNVGSLESMHVAGRFDDTDIVHVIQENLVMHSNPGGAFIHTSLTAPGTNLTVAAPSAGTGGFAAGSQSQIEYKIVFIDENGNEGLASNTVRITGTITTANSFVRLTNLPNVTASLVAQGFVGRRLYRRVGGVGDFVLVEQIPASSSSTYIDRNLPLPASALKLKVISATDTISPRIAGVTTLTSNSGGQYTAGRRVVYGLAYVDSEGRDTPMVEVPIAPSLTQGPSGSVLLSNLPLTYSSFVGLRIYRSIDGGQFDLIGMVDAGETSFRDTGTPVTPSQTVPPTVDINAAVAAIVPTPAPNVGFMNGQRVNYRFTFAGTGGETASAALAVPGGELGGFVISGNNRQITLSNLPLIDRKAFSQLRIYRSINYGKFELVTTIPVPVLPAAQITTFVDTNAPILIPDYLEDATLSPPATARARPHGSLVIDPSMVIKSDGARVDVGIGAGIIAEGVKGRDIVITSLYDQRYGAGGTFQTSKSGTTAGMAGDWAGIYLGPDAKGSFNNVVFAYGGGESRIEGTFAGINVLEIQQAKVRIANSRFEFNDSGVFGDQAPPDRSGRGTNDDATIFVRGAQPIVINNTVVNNQGSFISINVNALNFEQVTDWGRQTGLLAELPPGTPLTRISYPVARLTDTQTAVTDLDNNGPLIRLNRMDVNETNGMRVRGGVLTTESVWDDTDIAHVLFDSIRIPDFHTHGGLRLESGARESLVIKAASDPNTNTVAAIIADGRPLETEDRIGGTLQVLGQPGFPVVMTSYSDDTISAGLTPAGRPQSNTNGDSLLPPLPTIGEVANGLTIDNDVAGTVNGHFSATIGAAGQIQTSTVTAQGNISQFNLADFIFDYFPTVYMGGARVDLVPTVTSGPLLISPDVVVTQGEFVNTALTTIQWKTTSSFTNGSTRLNTTIEFNTTDGSALGPMRVVSYLDQDVGASMTDDILYLYGSPGQADFRVLTLDNPERVGLAQGGVYTPGSGLQNARYIGFTADKYNDLEQGLLAGTVNNFAILPNATGGIQNIDVTDLPLLADPALGNVWGTNDITTALAWDVTPTASSTLVTTFLELFPRSPVTAGRPGEWQGLIINEYANDRNVETVPEREPVSSNGSQNSRPGKAQFLGSLNGADKGGDENLRLGFVVHGAIGTPSDVDIYSFRAKSETEVWFDIDRSTPYLDSVIELIDEFGNVLNRSDNSADEAEGADSLIGDGSYKLQKTTPYEGQDFYTTNPKDPGMRVKLPGPPGVESTYFVRVRSVPKNRADLDTAVPSSVNESQVTAGASYGAYELQVRLREKAEKGGTTVRYAKLANAVTGIDVNGHPTHSPLSGERREVEPNNAGTLGGAQFIGNLLTVDRGALSINGSLNAPGDIDWYRFTLDFSEVDGNSPVFKEFPNLNALVNTVFDLDYADGLGRPNLQLFVFNENFELILTNQDSNVADDRPGPLTGSGISDLSRGSVGFNDAFIGNIALPATTPFSSNDGANPQNYYVAVAAFGTTPNVMDQYTNRNTANPLLRLEPLDSVHRIVEDHINEGTNANPRNFKSEVPTPFPDRGTSALPTQEILFDRTPGFLGVPGLDSNIPWFLGDTSLYISRDVSVNGVSASTGVIDTSTLHTFNPFTGAHMTTVGSFPFEVDDIDFNAGNNLFGLTQDVEDLTALYDDESGHLVQISTMNGGAADLGHDAIVTYELDPTGNPVVAHPVPQRVGYGIHYDALSFFTPGGGTEQILAGVGRRGETYLPGNINRYIDEKSNLLYLLDPNTGAHLAVGGGSRTFGAWTDAYEAGVILTEQRLTAIEATTTNNPFVIDPVTGLPVLLLNYSSNIVDGTQFTVSDALLSQVFEFNAGFEVTQTVNNATDQTIRDGQFFILDRDTDPTNRNEVVYHFDTGPVIAVRRTLNSNQITDGASFTVNAGGQSLVFEFDKDMMENNPNAVAVDISSVGGPLQADVIASLIAQAINAESDNMTFPVTASVTPGSTRVTLIPINPPAAFASATAFDPTLAGDIFVEGETGAAPILQAVSSPPLPGDPGDLEGRTFAIRIAGVTRTFEFDPANNGVVGGRIAVDATHMMAYNLTSAQVAAAMASAINAQPEHQATVYGDRVVVNGPTVDYIWVAGTPIVDLLDPSPAQGGLVNIPIVVEEDFTNVQLTTAVTTAVQTDPISPFSAGGDAATRTSRINFPPIEIPGVKVATRRLDITGMPLWVQNAAATPDYSPGTISVPFFAEDDEFTIADRIEAAIDGNLTGFNANVSGPYVTMDRGQIFLPVNSPFTTDGEGPGGNIVGIVNVPEVNAARQNADVIATFIAISDKGGLYEVNVNFINNLTLPVPSFLKSQQVSTTYIGQSNNDLAGIRFQGLTRGPAGVENGRYANHWFAIADEGPFLTGPTVNFTHNENNNTITAANATNVAPGGNSVGLMTNGFIGDGLFGTTSGDYDFYRVNLGAGENLTVEVLAAGSGQGTLADSYLTLYDAAGNVLARDDNGGDGLDSLLRFTSPAAGTYFIAVRGSGSRDLLSPFVGNTGGGVTFTGTYGLRVTREEFGDSLMYAFDYAPLAQDYNGFQPVFVDGQSVIPLTYRDDLGRIQAISDAKGIHFAQLNGNAWNLTPFSPDPAAVRSHDPGHGTPAIENGSRPETFGHSSYAFTAGPGGTYNVNNGAHGTIVSNEFSLEGYSAIDQPMLYFTYFSDHEQSLYDSLRVFISGIEDNNADRDGDGRADTNSGDWFPVAIDDQTQIVQNTDFRDTAVVGVQPTFTSTGSWRQARIPLGQWAGWKDLRLRIDFSTAGEMDVGTAYTAGEELRAVAGQYITDGQFVQIDGTRFEFESGVSATFSTGAATPDGETLTVTGSTIGSLPIVFEFDKDGVVNGTNDRIPITDQMTAQQVAEAVMRRLASAGMAGDVSTLTNNLVGSNGGALVIDAIINFAGSQAVVAAAPLGSPPGTQPVTVLNGTVGLTSALPPTPLDPDGTPAIAVPYRRAWTKVEVADSFNDVLEREFYDQKLIVQNGGAYQDGQIFQLQDVNNPLSVQTFEFETGTIMMIPTGGANNLLPANLRVDDGDVFTLTYNNSITTVTRTFEFDSDGVWDTVNNVRIPFFVNDTQSQVATAVSAAVDAAFPGLNSQVVNGARVQFDTDIFAQTFVNFTPSPIPADAAKYPVSGLPGVAGTNVPVFIVESDLFDAGQVSTAVARAINQATTLPGLVATTDPNSRTRVILVSANEYVEPNIPQPGTLPVPPIQLELTNVVANNNIKQYGDLIRLISSPTGPQHTVDIDLTTLLPFRGPFGWESILAGDVPDFDGVAPDPDGWRSNQRGQNNLFEGVYFDDFIIGLAERGEMVSQAPSNSATTTLIPNNQIITGDYQLEIRRGVGYDFVSPPVPTFTNDSNDRFTEQQTILARPGAEIVDGQTFTISDGNRQLTFEYNDVNQIPAPGVDAVTPGNQEIVFTSTMLAEEVAVAIRDAINRVDVQQILKVNAWLGDGVQPGLATTTNRVNLNGAATFVTTSVPVTERNENLATALEVTAPGIAYDGLRFFANGMIGDTEDAITAQNEEGRRERDVDYFGLDLVAGQKILVDIDAASAGSTLDSYLRIFNSSGVLQNITLPERFITLPRGTYLEFGGDPTLPYGLTTDHVYAFYNQSYPAENDGPTVPMMPNTPIVGLTPIAPPGAPAFPPPIVPLFSPSTGFPPSLAYGFTIPDYFLQAPGETLGETAVIGNTFSTRPDTDSYLEFIAPAAGRYYIGVSGAGNNRYNPVTGAGAIPGSTGSYQIEITSPNAAGVNSAGINSAVQTIQFDEKYGDVNLPRDQGQIIIQGNEVYNSQGYGIDIDAGARVAIDGNAPHTGAPRNLSQSNSIGLLPGVVVMNNVIYGNQLGGIRYSGDVGADAPVSYGRIINNTLFGIGGSLFPPPAGTTVTDIGIKIEERSGPTLLNNIVANFNTALDVDASSRPNTVIGGMVTQGNNILSNPANIGFGDFPILLTDQRTDDGDPNDGDLMDGPLVDPLFRNPTGANFYLEAGSRAIDSSVDSLLDRPLMVSIKAPLGIGESPVLTPDRDSRGQVRADDPAVQTPQGFGLNPFKDRGAIDRVDKVGPSAGLVNPQDNDSFGVDRDLAANIVSTDNTVLIRNFTVALFDRTDPNGEPDGSDIDDFTVTTDQVIVTRRTGVATEQVLQAGVDYFFAYDSTSNLIILTPVGNVWTRGTYRIYVNNGILDQAGNPLSQNNTVALPNPVTPTTDTIDHYYDVFIGTAVDYGDAPVTFPVLAADNGANHFITPGVYIGQPPTADFDGKPGTSALGDTDDGVTFGSLLPGVANGSTITVVSPTDGLKLSAWIDFDGTVGWDDTAERVLTNHVLTAGTNTITFSIPNGQRGVTYARFRVSTQDMLTAGGAATDGEVEDYQVTLTGPLFQNGDTILVNIPGQGIQNVGNLDVNDDGNVTAFDALTVINFLNLYGVGPLPRLNPPPGLQPILNPPPYLDTNGSGTLTALDALAVINFLNLVPILPPGSPESVSVGGGGEPPPDEDISAGEYIGEEPAAEAPSAEVIARLLRVTEATYASSSIVFDTVPAPNGGRSVEHRSPVEAALDHAAYEQAVLAITERQATEQVSFDGEEAIDLEALNLDEGDWSQLLHELAAEQAHLG